MCPIFVYKLDNSLLIVNRMSSCLPFSEVSLEKKKVEQKSSQENRSDQSYHHLFGSVVLSSKAITYTVSFPRTSNCDAHSAKQKRKSTLNLRSASGLLGFLSGCTNLAYRNPNIARTAETMNPTTNIARKKKKTQEKQICQRSRSRAKNHAPWGNTPSWSLPRRRLCWPPRRRSTRCPPPWLTPPLPGSCCNWSSEPDEKIGYWERERTSQSRIGNAEESGHHLTWPGGRSWARRWWESVDAIDHVVKSGKGSWVGPHPLPRPPQSLASASLSRLLPLAATCKGSIGVCLFALSSLPGVGHVYMQQTTSGLPHYALHPVSHILTSSSIYCPLYCQELQMSHVTRVVTLWWHHHT